MSSADMLSKLLDAEELFIGVFLVNFGWIALNRIRARFNFISSDVEDEKDSPSILAIIITMICMFVVDASRFILLAKYNVVLHTHDIIFLVISGVELLLSMLFIICVLMVSLHHRKSQGAFDVNKLGNRDLWFIKTASVLAFLEIFVTAIRLFIL